MTVVSFQDCLQQSALDRWIFYAIDHRRSGKRLNSFVSHLDQLWEFEEASLKPLTIYMKSVHISQARIYDYVG